MGDLIQLLEDAPEGSEELDARIACHLNDWPIPPGDYVHWAMLAQSQDAKPWTTSMDSAVTLMPAGATNISLRSFGGHGKDHWPRDAWMFNFMDRDQLMGKLAATQQIERWRTDLGASFNIFEQALRGPPVMKLEDAIAEHFIEFAGLAATPPLAISVAALKARETTPK